MKKVLLMVVIGSLLMSMIASIAFAAAPNPYTYISASIGDPDSLDPAKCYDQASGQLLFNTYETLVFWDENDLGTFVGYIAEDWTISENLDLFTFNIRQGVPWHDPAYGYVTAEDVEYSLERVLVLDYTGGPEWMLYEPLLGCYHADLDDPDWMQKIDAAITRDDGAQTVTLHCQMSCIWMLHVLSNVYGPAVMCKQWCIDNGDWDGAHTQESLLAFHDPADPWMDVLDHSSPGPHLDAAMGTGPYIFDYWDHGIEWSLVKFDDYWRGWPNPETTYLGHVRRGYVERYTYKRIDDWAPRRDAFMVGDYDNIYVPREYIGQLEGESGIECLYPYPGYGVAAMFFGYNVSTTSPYLGVEGGLPYGTLDVSGIPPDFFSDVHVRKGFAYCVDYETMIRESMLGEASQPTSPLAEGLAPDVRNPEQPVYSLDLERAEAEFRLAYGGELWTTGFTTGIAYNTGNVPRETICYMLKTHIESLNPNFHIDVYSVDWGSVYIPQLVSFELNMFIIGWGADYPDPHNFMYTFMGTYGDFAYFQRIKYSDAVGGNEYVDGLLTDAILTNVEDERRAIYYELQEIYFDECPSVGTWDAWARRWQRTWVQGWYYNGIYSGAYAYSLWKEELPREDIDEDGAINIRDIFRVAKAFGASFAPGVVHPRWDPYTDINSDALVNIRDIFAVAKLFGYTAPDWTPP